MSQEQIKEIPTSENDPIATGKRRFSLESFIATGITCRDAPALYGEISGYSLQDLWNDKVEETVNLRIEIGDDLFTSKAKKLFLNKFFVLDELNGHDLPTTYAESTAIPFMRALIDGGNFQTDVLVRIVHQDRARFDAVADTSAPVRSARVSERHWIEIQHEMIVTGIRKAFFVSTVDGSEINYVKVERDDIFASNHVATCIIFWDRVKRGVPPNEPLTRNVSGEPLDPKIKSKSTVVIDAELLKKYEILLAASERILSVTSIKGLPERDLEKAVKHCNERKAVLNDNCN